MMRRRSERGAVAVVMALVICLVLIPLAAMAVDLGMQRVARTDMQSVADMVALDTARELNGGPLSSYPAAYQDGKTVLTADGTTGASASLRRNSSSVGAPAKVIVQLGSVDPDKYGQPGYFTEMTRATDVPSAVRVLASTDVDFGLARALPKGGVSSGGAARVAIAMPPTSACFKIGTFAASLATDRSMLNGLLGNALGTGVLGYDGLVTSKLSLLGLSNELGFGTVDELLDSNVSLGRLLSASAQVLKESSPFDTNIQLLGTIGAALSAKGLAGKSISLGKIIDVGVGRGSGLDASLNLLDLIQGVAFLSNKDAFISVPSAGLSLPGVGSLSLTLSVIKPPVLGCNGGTASSGQFELKLGGNLEAGVPLVLTVGGPIQFSLGLAEAKATLDRVICVNGEPTGIAVKVANQGLTSTTLYFGDPDQHKWLSVKALLGIVEIPLLNASVSTQQPNPSGTYQLSPWQNYVTSPFHTPQTRNLLPELDVDVGLAGIDLGDLLKPLLRKVLNPLVVAVNTLVANVIAPALGIKLAGVDLWTVPTPVCGANTDHVTLVG